MFIVRHAKPEDVFQYSSILAYNNYHELARIIPVQFDLAFSKTAWHPTFLSCVDYRDYDKVIGFVGFTPSWLEDDIIEISWLYVDPLYHGKGAGKALLNQVETLTEGYINAWMTSTTKTDFFTKRGYSTISWHGSKTIMIKKHA